MDHNLALLIDRPSAVPRLAELFIAEWAPWYGPNGKGHADADLVACMNRGRLPIAVVAQGEDGRILGTAALKEESLGSEYGYGPWLAAVVVDRDCRRHGIGSALIQAVEEQARRLGFTEIYTSTDTAITIVTRRGWKAVGASIQSLRGPVSVFRLDLCPRTGFYTE